MSFRNRRTAAWLIALAAGTTSLTGCRSFPEYQVTDASNPTEIDRSVLAKYETHSPATGTQGTSVREPRWGVEGEGADGIARVATGKPAPHRATPSGDQIALTSYNAAPG